MFAIAIDGELLTSKAEAREVQKILRFRQKDEKVEVAAFEPSLHRWIPVCLEQFAHAV